MRRPDDSETLCAECFFPFTEWAEEAPGFRLCAGCADQRVTRCACCGGPCDAADAVATDAGLAFCGSFYGNGCADSGCIDAATCQAVRA
jgi:hypothetical protein